MGRFVFEVTEGGLEVVVASSRFRVIVRDGGVSHVDYYTHPVDVMNVDGNEYPVEGEDGRGEKSPRPASDVGEIVLVTTEEFVHEE